MERVPVSAVRRDGGTQSRSFNDGAIINEYKELMLSGHEFDPIDCFFDGTDYWLADGFHRVIAAEGVGKFDIAANIHQGTKRDAILFSVGANSRHGLKRNNADKRRAVKMLLDDEEWGVCSNVWIAEKCGVDESLVRRVKEESGSVKPNVKGKDGKTYPSKKVKPVTQAPSSPKVQSGAGAATLLQSRNNDGEILSAQATSEEAQPQNPIEEISRQESSDLPKSIEPTSLPKSPDSSKELITPDDIETAQDFLRFAVENKSQLRFDVDLLSDFLRRAMEIAESSIRLYASVMEEARKA